MTSYKNILTPYSFLQKKESVKLWGKVDIIYLKIEMILGEIKMKKIIFTSYIFFLLIDLFLLFSGFKNNNIFLIIAGICGVIVFLSYMVKILILALLVRFY